MFISEYCKTASRGEIFDLFTKLSRALIKQEKIKNKSSQKELDTKVKNKNNTIPYMVNLEMTIEYTMVMLMI